MEEVKKQSDSGIEEDMPKKLVLFNSHHVWEEVIIQVRKATGYEIVHCEQIAMIAHTKGKAIVKTGALEELQRIESVLKEINLVTKIE